MVVLKTSGELAKMKKAGSLAAQALRAGGAAVRPGVTTGEIDRIGFDQMERQIRQADNAQNPLFRYPL